jgi:TonB family protein
LGDLVPLDQVDTQPVVLQRTEAIYPPLGVRFGIEGTVIVNALVSETGSVIRTSILRKIKATANYGFEQASEDAVKNWKFKPAVKDGVSVKTWMPVGVVFKAR